MPTYSYVCKDCGHAFDIQQAFTDDALTACPSCGGSLRKVFSAVGVVFKGSGFYRNDSRDSSTPKSSTTHGGASSGKAEGSTPSSGSSAEGGSTTSTAATKNTQGTPSTSTPAASKSSTGTD